MAKRLGILAAVAAIGIAVVGGFVWNRTRVRSPDGAANARVTIQSETSTGEGARGQPGRRLTVQYEIYVAKDGKPERKVDSSRDRATPFEFLLGTGQVFPGWDKAIEGMAVGARRTVLIPSALAYGERGAAGVVLPGEDLVLDVELLKVE